MKTWLMLGALCFGALAIAPAVEAATVSGKVTFVGTMSEVVANGGLQMRFRFRVTNSTCTGQTGTAPTRWIIVHSGIMTAPLEHNMANARAAYNAVMASLLSGKSVQVDGVASCNAAVDQQINLWTSAIGVF